jgi:putative two-component system response regulator
MADVVVMTPVNFPESTPGPTSPGRILVVEDEQAIGELLSSALRHKGYDCRNCLDGEEALSLLEKQSFDAVISDLRMPGITGLELLKMVRLKYPFVAFLMATGVDEVRVGVQAMKDGADDYLVKPFSMENVLSSVDRALEKKRLDRTEAGYRQSLEFMVDQRTKQLRAAMQQTVRI